MAARKRRASGESSTPAPQGVPVTLATLGRAGDYGALAHYADARYYDLTYGDRKHDVDYYVRLARQTKAPVLEYGTGTGRVALPIARAGVPVVGVDRARPMLDGFEARLAKEPKQVRGRVELVHGDMREVSLGRRFELVIAPFNTVLHLYQRDEIEAFFARVQGHLSPTGRFVFDFSVPHGEDLVRDPEKRFAAPRLRHPTTGVWTRYAERFEYDRVRQLLLIWMEFTPEDGSEPWSVPLTHRQYFPQEMAALLHHAGFSEVRFTGDFGGSAPDQYVDSMVATCSVVATEPANP